MGATAKIFWWIEVLSFTPDVQSHTDQGENGRMAAFTPSGTLTITAARCRSGWMCAKSGMPEKISRYQPHGAEIRIERPNATL